MIKHPIFDVTIISFIVCNVVVMALDQDDIDLNMQDSL